MLLPTRAEVFAAVPAPLPPESVLAGTGHRPQKLRMTDADGRTIDGFDPAVDARLIALATRMLTHWTPSLVISGMALGWDMALADAAVALGIPFDAYVPFLGQERRWSRPQIARYKRLLSQARRVIVVSEGDYAAWKMTVRNQAMIDVATHVAALFDGSAGGTADGVRKAEAAGKPIIHLWPFWARHASPTGSP